MNLIRVIDPKSSYFNRIGCVRQLKNNIYNLYVIFIDNLATPIKFKYCQVTEYIPYQIGDKVKIIPSLDHRLFSEGSSDSPLFQINVNFEMLKYKGMNTTISEIDYTGNMFRVAINSKYRWSNDLLIPINEIVPNIF